MNIADILVLVIIAIYVFVGFKRGFVLSLFRLGSFLASLVLSYLFRPYLSAMMLKTPLFFSIKESIRKTLVEKMKMPEISIKTPNATDIVNGALEQVPLPELMKDGMKVSEASAASHPELFNTASLYDSMSTHVATMVVNTLSFIILLVGLMLVFFVVRLFLQKVMSLPVLKQADKLGGFAIGLVEGVFIVYVCFAVIMFLYSAGKAQGFVDQIAGSNFAWFFYKQNFLLQWLKI